MGGGTGDATVPVSRILLHLTRWGSRRVVQYGIGCKGYSYPRRRLNVFRGDSQSPPDVGLLEGSVGGPYPSYITPPPSHTSEPKVFGPLVKERDEETTEDHLQTTERPNVFR